MPDRHADTAQVKAVIADIERGFNTKDPELSVTHFLPEAWTVNVTGTDVSGRDALLAADREGYSGPLGFSADIRVPRTGAGDRGGVSA
jgi:uncharacterized protein (TIGR02246 family)